MREGASGNSHGSAVEWKPKSKILHAPYLLCKIVLDTKSSYSIEDFKDYETYMECMADFESFYSTLYKWVVDCDKKIQEAS